MNRSRRHDSQCAETSFCMDLYHSDAYGGIHSDTSYDKNLFPLREKCDAETQNKLVRYKQNCVQQNC